MGDHGRAPPFAGWGVELVVAPAPPPGRLPADRRLLGVMRSQAAIGRMMIDAGNNPCSSWSM